MATESPRAAALAAWVVARARWVIAAWVLVVVGLNLAIPQLETVVARDSTPVVPPDAPSVLAIEKMDETFGNGKTASFIYVVIERDGGLTKVDQRYLHELTRDLADDTENVAFVQDLSKRPEIRRADTSEDGEALYLQVGVPGETGAPSSLRQIEAVRDLVTADPPAGLNVAVTGPAATIADMSVEIEHSIALITVATVALIGLILMVIYRSFAVTALILTVIGLALGASRALTAWAGLHVFNVSTFTGSFLTAVVLGAGTDYAVFLISRYQELRRAGVPVEQAATAAASKVSGVIIGSALTVAVANVAMLLADVGIFRTTGPAIALSVLVTLAISLTLTPAVLRLAGARGLMEPRPKPSRDYWREVATRVVSRPVRWLAIGLAPLLLLAGFYPLMERSFDERGVHSPQSDSNVGYRLLSQHFPLNEVLPDFVVISAERDLRNPRDLAVLEQAADAVARTDDVISVRGVTRPLGETLTQASLGYQAGEVGQRLGRAGDRLKQGTAGAKRLADGSARLYAGAEQLAAGADRAVAGTQQLVDGSAELARGLTRLAAGTTSAQGGSAELSRGARQLAAALQSGYDQTKVAVDGLGLAYQALQQSPACRLDPICVRARDGVRQVHEGQRDQLLPGLARAADGARQLAQGGTQLQNGLVQLNAGMAQAQAGSQRLQAGQDLLRSKLGELAQGADQVATGTDAVSNGTAQLSGSVGELRSGLARAARYLKQTGQAAADPAIGGFYLPPSAFEDPRLALASGLFLSPDGRTARFIVLGEAESFGARAMQRSADIEDAARKALQGTSLSSAEVSVTGVAGINRDLAELSQRDFYVVASLALLAVLLILIFLLRSLVAPLLLLGAVCLSYAAALGLGVVVWQYGLGQDLDWTAPTIAFILLVAVGADYNLLLMKRMQEDAADGSAKGIIEAVALTGGVITSAGVIFAASMFALMLGSVDTLAQMGFTIGMGLLIDTFIVRTLVVPAGAALLGRHLWWPRRPVPAAG